mgnify:CR=1 FL=1
MAQVLVYSSLMSRVEKISTMHGNPPLFRSFHPGPSYLGFARRCCEGIRISMVSVISGID